jgi:DNA topoisomerase III
LPGVGKRLVITEKPSVARDIVHVLGGFQEHEGFWENDQFVVTFAVGHLLELPAPEDLDPKFKRWTLDTLPILPEVFPLKPKAGASERLRIIKKLERRADVDSMVNACDAGREGELIFREIVEYLESEKSIERLWLQSMTSDAIRVGFEVLRPGAQYERLSAAAHCRNYSDWLIGMNATRALTRRLKTRSENQAWSAGRVQTPTLGMLVHREREVLRHRPAPYWMIHSRFGHEGEIYEGVWFDPNFVRDQEGEDVGPRDDRIFDQKKAEEILHRVIGKAALASEERKPSKETAPPLFDLTSLQREGNRRFGWSARRTLNAAQRCYEAHKVLTYPRTSSRALPEDYKPVVDEVIGRLGQDERFQKASQRLGADGLLNTQRIFDNSKVSDHFAIVPTGELSTALSGDDARVFELVTRRFLAAFYPPAVWSKVERITRVESDHFRSRARTLEIPGWREVFQEVDDEEKPVRLPPLVPGLEVAADVEVEAQDFQSKEEETKPPPHITEARLLSLMEHAGREVEDEDAREAMKDCGIGTPATRADILENLISKGYVMRAGRALRPSVKGIRLIDILERMDAQRLASPELTGQLEQFLLQVERGEAPAEAFMKEVYGYTREVVELAKNFEFDEIYPYEDPLGVCPLCQEEVFEHSWFYRCRPKEGIDPRKDENDCPFRVWKDKSGRYVDRETVRELLKDGRSRVLDGFLTRQGRSYKGRLELLDGRVELERLESSDDSEGISETPEYEVDERSLGPCPRCTAPLLETRGTFVCSTGLGVLRAAAKDEASTLSLRKREIPEGMDYCPVLLPRTVCRREVTREEALTYFTQGKTEVLTDFISRKGRPFSATLVLKDTGRHGFEFLPRGGAQPAAEGDGTDGSTGAAPKRAGKKKTVSKASTAKKTVTKKKATKKSGTKKTSTKKKASAEASTDQPEKKVTVRRRPKASSQDVES